MPSLLEQLGNEQALLMHLAGELPPEDAVELEQMLQSDRRLSAELETLRDAREQVFGALASLDRAEPPPVTEPMAIRGVHRRLNLQRLQPVAPEGEGAPKSRLRYPWWAYPMATAAAVLLAFLVWWGNSDYSPHWFGPDTQTAWNASERPGFSRRMARRERMDPELRAAYIEAHQRWLADWLAASFAGDEAQSESSDASLAQAERQVATLVQPDQQTFPLLMPSENNQ
jgi:anti-sigma factor RsiW